MKDLLKECKNYQLLSARVIDEFLIDYSVKKNRADRAFVKRLGSFRHITNKIPGSWLNMIISQYIAYTIFRKKGYISAYLNHSGLKHLKEEEKAFLQSQADKPWRFSFAEIKDNPDKDFYKMSDAFTGEEYLLYSPAISNILVTQKIRLCFNLISNSGNCYHTYGPISAYNAFQADDIRFYAQQIKNSQAPADDTELMELVHRDPVPFMCLFYGSAHPFIQHNEHQMVEISAEYLDDTFDSAPFKNHFTIQYSHGVYRFSPNGWDQFPHYSKAYYDEAEELLFLHAMSDAGFRKLIDALNQIGYELSYHYDTRAGVAMLQTAKDILRREIRIDRYEQFFLSDEPEENDGDMIKINQFLSELIPYINSGNMPDLKNLAAKHGIDPEEASEIYRQVKAQTGI